MPQYTCLHCQQPFSAPSNGSANSVHCPRCKQTVKVPATSASRWFVARDKKKTGPYTWQQLASMVERGELNVDDHLLPEGGKKWQRAASVEGLFPAAPKPGRKRSALPWILAGVSGAFVCAILGVASTLALVFLRNDRPTDPVQARRDNKQVVKKDDRAKVDGVAIKKDGPPPGNDKEPEEKKKPQKKEKDSENPPREKLAEPFVERLNRQRLAAGLGPLTLDVDLSRGCEAHAKYLARHVDPARPDASDLYEQDSKKVGFTPEGDQAARNCMIAFQEPALALDRWMGRVFSRVSLLNTEIKAIGFGYSKNEQGAPILVVDVMRGRGDPIIAYPAPKQTDAPTTFSGGPDVPDSKAAAGLPISVSFPPAKRVTAASIAVHDPQGKTLDAWISTPELPLRPDQKLNALGLIPKSHLEANTLYQVKASATLDGKPWNLAWSFTTDDDSDTKGFWAHKALAKVNAYRAGAGLKPVELDDALSKNCLKHARYLVINEGHPSLQGLDAHKEDPKLPGYSKEGHEAGMASDIAIGDYEPIDAVDSWMATLYHRVPVLEPGLKSIGFGCARGRRQGWATVMNVGAGRDKGVRAHAVYYPAPDQIDVPWSFPNSGEEPNPIPEDKDGRAGYPVTAFFPQNAPLVKATGKLTNDKGIEVPCWFSSPDMPANPKHTPNQGNTVCLIAKDPLAPKTTYHVHVQGTLQGKAWEKKWKFTTIETGQAVENGKRAVIERLKHFRAQAGLAAVELDPGLSRGCQLHAEYLAKNADTLQKMKASVNKEDPTLPWFTAEGHRAAEQSMVFSHAPTPVMQIDDLMATFTARTVLLDPTLQRVGFGCAHDVGKGWRCVLDPNGGRGDGRTVLFPAPNQKNVPLLGIDRLDEGKGPIGFPITVAFPQRAVVRKILAALSDSEDNKIAFALFSPEKPINPKLQRNIVALYPLEPLQPGHSYSATVSAIVNGDEWRQTWQFHTSK